MNGLQSLNQQSELESADERKDLLNLSKLAKLPESQRNLIANLSLKELRNLRTVFRMQVSAIDRSFLNSLVTICFSYPNFLNLPTEIRELIYKFLFDATSSEGIVWSYPTREAGKMLPIDILCTSREVYKEAIATLHQCRTVKIKNDWWQRNGVTCLTPVGPYPSLQFRKLHLIIKCYKSTHRFDYGLSHTARDMTALGYVLDCWCKFLVEQKREGKPMPKKEIALEFKYSHNTSLQIDTDPWNPCWDARFWFRVHVAFAVERIRTDMNHQLTGRDFLLTSNVEDAVPGVTVVRESAQVLHFSYGSKNWTLTHRHEWRIRIRRGQLPIAQSFFSISSRI